LNHKPEFHDRVREFEVQLKELISKENQLEGGEVKLLESISDEFDGEPKENELRENQYEALLKS